MPETLHHGVRKTGKWFPKRCLPVDVPHVPDARLAEKSPNELLIRGEIDPPLI